MNLLSVLLSFIIYIINGSKWHPDRLDKDIYYWLTNEAKCVRLSTIYNRTGCATFNDGMHAQLRYVNNKTDISNLIDQNPTNEKIAVVMSLSLLTTNLINNLAESLTNINGIIFLQDTDDDEILKPPFISNGYSSGSVSPSYYLRPKSHKFNYIWNPYGTDNYLREYKFAMITINPSQSAHIKKLAMTNEDNIKSGAFGSHFVEFTYPMLARNDSGLCLEKDNCLPVGGYSVWTTFQDFNVNESEIYDPNVKSDNDIIMATTWMDTTCLFHQNICRGGNGNIAGLVGWLAAIEALSNIKHVLNNENITKSDKQIIFAAFQGESYDLIGSRKFVYDLQNDTFQCKTPMTVSDTGYGCWEPYASSLEFKKINFTKIKSVIELSQIGMSSMNENNKISRTIYAHYEREIDSNVTKQEIENIINYAKLIGQNISNEQSMGFDIQSANSSDNILPGTPPSSYWSFLNGNINDMDESLNEIPGIVFTDYDLQFKNKWFHSVYDSYYNNLNIEQICMTSTLYARLLYKLSLANDTDYNETFVASNINANCLLIEQLLECLLLDMTCDLVSNFSPKSKDSTPSHYTSVYRIIEDNDIGGTAKFIFRFVANLTRKTNDKTFGSCSKNLDCAGKGNVCGGTNHGKYCMDSQTYFHSAVDTNLQFDYNTNRWSIIGNDTLIFTESMWNKNIGTRFYEKESDETQIIMLISGMLMMICNFIITWRFKIYCKHKFPYLSRGFAK